MRYGRKLETLIIVFLIIGCSAKNNMSYKNAAFEKNIKLHSQQDKNLVNRFLKYWEFRTKGELRQSYKMELPYQRYLVPFEKYKGLIGDGYRDTKIILKKIYHPTNNVAILTREIVRGNRRVVRKDKWILTEGQWYHKFYQSILPSVDDAEYQ